MGLFQKKIGPVFLKEDSDAEGFIDKMNELLSKAEGALQKEIETQIKLAKYGLIGEKNLAYELKNSGIDMYILHDLFFECDDLQAQIDYLLITKKKIYVLECKNLIGNIEIDSEGNFIRTYELFGRKVKEGLYSPITQNERHRQVIKNLRAQEKNWLGKYLFEKSFDSTYQSIVVLANPKTYLNAKFAKKTVKNQVIRADQLISYLKGQEANSEVALSLDGMRELAEWFLTQNNPHRSDYARKYEELVEAMTEFTQESNEEKNPKEEVIQEEVEEKERVCPRCGANLVVRTAKKGDNAGKQFFGCSAFPNCRYIEKID